MIHLEHKFNNDSNSPIEITPLVDIVFLLLIFFLLTASYIHPVMNLELPEAKSAKPYYQQAPYTISIGKDGHISINNKASPIESISRIPSASKVLIMEDEEGPYGTFIKVLDILRLVGIDNISIATAKK